MAAARVGKSARGLYVLLGDDIVIADDDIARAYQELLRELDIEISEAKTHVSPDLCEFAKR